MKTPAASPPPVENTPLAARKQPARRRATPGHPARALAWAFAATFAWNSATAQSQPDKPRLLCVSVAGEKQIKTYRQNSDSGALQLLSQTPVPAQPGFLAANRAGTRLFAACRSSGQLASYKIEPQTGRLQQISIVPAGADPAYVALDSSESFLLSAYYRAGKVSVHQISPQGALDAKTAHWHSTAKNAHAILLDRANQWAFVPHTGPNAIHIFSFDAATGSLSPATIPLIHTGAHTGPRHLQFHPSLDRLYFNNEQGSSVSVFDFDRKKGRIQRLQTLTTLPPDFDKPNTCADLEITPDGHFLYAANRGHNSIAGFRISPQTGQLKSIGQFPTETIPRSFTITPCGKWLIAAGQTSGYLQTCEIQPTTGYLIPRHRTKAGSRPWAVLAIHARPQ